MVCPNKFLKGILALGALVAALPVVAQEAQMFEKIDVRAAKEAEWRLNLRRISLDFSNTDVKNAKEYENSPVSQLSADSQMIVKGVFDAAVEYDHTYSLWTNTLYMDYGKTKLKKVDGEKSTSENTDIILLTTDYAQKVWRYKEIDIGPFVNIGYQTEFTENTDAPREKLFRGKVGMKAFNGEVFKDVYIAAIGEYDMTYSTNVSKSGAEVGGRFEYVLREGIKFSGDGYYRRYFSYSDYIGTDLRYDLKVIARMDVALYKNFALGPYVSYRRAHDRQSSVAGSNFMIGLSFSYSDLFNLN
ncbi:MAG: hypothetical protein LBU87_01555 [Lactobacillales bacterium]|jgi:hypothetical protein|nr:hypothetical protein [Lactobacillales bacterium]